MVKAETAVTITEKGIEEVVGILDPTMIPPSIIIGEVDLGVVAGIQITQGGTVAQEEQEEKIEVEVKEAEVVLDQAPKTTMDKDYQFQKPRGLCP